MHLGNKRAAQLAARIFLLFVGFVGAQQGLASSTTDWLVSRADATSGAIHTAADIALPVQSTAEAILAFVSADQAGVEPFAPASQFVLGQTLADTETLARQVLTAAENRLPTSAFISKLLTHQNPDGGFGDEPGFGSSVLNTAFALSAIDASGISVPEQVGGAVNYLFDAQQDNGGWSDGSNVASPYLTAFVVSALQRYRYEYNAGARISSASEFLLQQLRGDQLNSDFELAVVLLALVPVSTDSTLYQPALDKLRSLQLGDGSWNEDVFTTAVALRAIRLAESMVPPPPPPAGSLAGQLVNGISGAPLAGANVTIAGDKQVTVQTGLDGRFLADDLKPQSHAVTYAADGFAAITHSVAIEPGQRLDLGVIMLVAPSGNVRISGTVTDATTGLPIPATVSVLGPTSATVSTDSAGFYSLHVAPGPISITVTATGYQGIITRGTAQAGVNLDFSPVLYPDGATPPDTGVTVRGAVLDADTRAPLPGVEVSVVGTAAKGGTDVSGAFSIPGLAAGDIRLEITKEGYQPITLDIIAAEHASVDLGAIYLLPTPAESSTIYGSIRNKETGTPVADAVVQVGGFNARSDANGLYRIEGIPALEFDVTANATGYLSETVHVKFSQYGSMQLDIPIQKIAVDGLHLSKLLKDKSEYQAFEEVVFTAELENRGTDVHSVVLVAEVFGPSGNYVEDFVVPASASSRDPGFTLDPAQTVSVAFSWSTRNYPPGDCRVVVKALSEESRSVLSEEATVLAVNETKRLSLLDISPATPYFVRGQSGDIELLAQIRNGSNVDIGLTLGLEVTAPDGSVIDLGSHQLDLPATSILSTVPLTSVNHLFDLAGTYAIAVSDIAGVVVESVQTGHIDVAPDIRIEGQLGVDPQKIIPGADKDVAIKLNIKGVENAHE